MSRPTVNMPYVRLGNSGLKVSRIILGCMSYGDPAWQSWVLPEDESMEHIKKAYDLGINAFDTANVYSSGASEIILGRAIKRYNLPRDEIVVMTKVFYVVGRQTEEVGWNYAPQEIQEKRYINQHGLSRKHIFDSVKRSLERLQLDYIDLLQCHRFDPNTPIEETMQALHDVVKAGYVRYIGMSSCYAWQFHKMQNHALTHGLTPFISMQNFHNAIYREEEREIMPLLKDMGVGCIPWSPLARGFLTRSIDSNTVRNKTDGFLNEVVDSEKYPFLIEINHRVKEISEKRGVSMAQVALAWQLSKDFISAPIVGATKIANLEDLAAGVHVKLTEEELKYIDEPYLPREVIGLQ
ncbi:hypothetical protein FRC02_005943 [Tulasnella sp. 418]|nr:hypothetical protein FRC02_005943 [Tulasnella sp. 418]